MAQFLVLDYRHGGEIATLSGLLTCAPLMRFDQWAYQNGVQFKLIEPGKPTQNAYIKSFNGRFRDECLNNHWFTSLAEARIRIAAWRRD